MKLIKNIFCLTSSKKIHRLSSHFKDQMGVLSFAYSQLRKLTCERSVLFSYERQSKKEICFLRSYKDKLLYLRFPDVLVLSPSPKGSSLQALPLSLEGGGLSLGDPKKGNSEEVGIFCHRTADKVTLKITRVTSGCVWAA